MSNFIYFNKELKLDNEKVLSKLGIRGRRAVELASMGLPIVPGFILDSDVTQKLDKINIKEQVTSNIVLIEKETKKKFGDNNKPLFL